MWRASSAAFAASRSAIRCLMSAAEKAPAPGWVGLRLSDMLPSRAGGSAAHQLAGVAGDHEILVGFYHISADAALRRADARLLLSVGGLVELDPEPGAGPADGAAHGCRVFADACGEDDPVETAERRCERADLASGSIIKHLERKSRPQLRAGQQLAKIRGNTREPQHAGTSVEQIDQRVARHPLLLDQMQHDTGIERAAAGAHRQAVEGGKTHRRGHRNARLEGAGGAAIAEMRDDNPAVGDFRRLLREY